MELAPFPCGRLPGFHRAMSLHPSGCVLLCGPKYSTRYRQARKSGVEAQRPRADHASVTRVRPRCSGRPWQRDLPNRSSASRRCSRAGTPPAQADADHRQSVRHDGLRPAQEPRRLRAARQLRGRRRSTPRPAITPPSCAARPPREGYDVVVAFGGDGTVNEAANGLAGSDTPLSCLPGGRTNVYCRMLGIPTDVVDATEHLLRLADDWAPRRVDVGRVERPLASCSPPASGSTPAWSSGSTPTPVSRPGSASGTTPHVALRTFARRYLLHPPRLEATLDDERVAGVSAVRPERDAVHVLRQPPGRHRRGRHARQRRPLGGGARARAARSTCPRSSGGRSPSARLVGHHRHVHPFAACRSSTIRSLDDRPLPLQVDGDYIGEVPEATFGVTPRGLTVVS